MMIPAHKNSIALKKAWVQIWKNAKLGRLMPMETIIKPS